MQLDKKEEKILSEICFGTWNWPSSTKPELLAIWFVILAAPKQRKVKICTDSAAAIAGLKNGKKNQSTKQWLKRKNYNLLENIRNIIALKNLEIDLVKVKGHSDNKWNNRTDSWAKEEAKIDSLDKIVEKTPQGTSISIYWKKKIIEDPTRKFIKEILDLWIRTEWRFSLAIKKTEPDDKKKLYN